MSLSLDEFLRRFLLHLLPRGFVRIRHFGFLANRRRATLLPLCFQLLGAAKPSPTEAEASPAQEPSPLWPCPKCGGRHRKTYGYPNPTPFSTLPRRSRHMIRPFPSPPSGASDYLPPSCTLLAPKSATRLVPLKLLPQPRANSHRSNPACPLLHSAPSSPGLSHHSNTIQFA